MTAAFLAVLVLMAAAATAATWLSWPLWLTFVSTVLLGLPLGAVAVTRILRPLNRALSGLGSGVAAFGDRDFSLRLVASRNDELGELARLFNAVGEILQDERREVRQKELLLTTALARSPVATILVGPTGRVVYSNPEARRLLLGGRKLEGRQFAEIRAGCPQSMRDILSGGSDGLFSVRREDRVEAYHLAQRVFQLNRRRHTLVLLQRMSDELDRQEAEAWKKVIRVICHELNNSLAPVSSLVHSAKTIINKPEKLHRIEEVFGSIQERLLHLKQFIDGYARFARLPKPRRAEVRWSDLLDCVTDHAPVRVVGRLPDKAGCFDRSQMEQLLLNLFKNAVEASEGDPDIEVRVRQAGHRGVYLQVDDRGRGMEEETMKQALVPFYSTKQQGTGLGLPLCREIIEAHGGRIELQARDGGGTSVICWLPADTDQSARERV